MTLEQLAIFIAVAEREHLTKAAAALRLTPSAVSAAIKSLENFYNVQLFDRVGRGIELTRDGRAFLKEARETVARAKAAELVLSELGGLRTGALDVHASQTIANYWLPPRLMTFAGQYPGISVNLTVGNTAQVAAAVLSGAAELGFIEGELDEPALHQTPILTDRLIAVTAPTAEAVADLTALKWIMREPGSGTRSMFETGLKAIGIDPDRLDVVLVLPSNEAVLAAVRSAGPGYAAALSQVVVDTPLRNGHLAAIGIDLPPRRFTVLRHRERRLSAAAKTFLDMPMPEADGDLRPKDV